MKSELDRLRFGLDRLAPTLPGRASPGLAVIRRLSLLVASALVRRWYGRAPVKGRRPGPPRLSRWKSRLLYCRPRLFATAFNCLGRAFRPAALRLRRPRAETSGAHRASAADQLACDRHECPERWRHLRAAREVEEQPGHLGSVWSRARGAASRSGDLRESRGRKKGPAGMRQLAARAPRRDRPTTTRETGGVYGTRTRGLRRDRPAL
jgi:hypothetical protein